MPTRGKTKRRGRPDFSNPADRKDSKMTVCLTIEYKKKLKKVSNLEPGQTPASMARHLIEKGINEKLHARK